MRDMLFLFRPIRRSGSKPRHAILLLAVFALLVWAPWSADRGMQRWSLLPSAQAQTTSPSTVTVAPNLMVILGNAYSMNRMMDNQTLPPGPGNLEIQSRCPRSYGGAPFYPAPVFANDPGCGGSGTPFPDGLYGNQPQSKLYIAKQVLYNLLSSEDSSNINFGFATYRQAFGMENSVVTALTNAFWPKVIAPGGSPANPLGIYRGKTQTELNSLSRDPNNMAWVLWWPGWDDANRHSFYLGSGQPNNAANVITSFLSGGLPTGVQYPPGTISNTTVGSFSYGSGGLDIGPPINANPTDPEPLFRLCKTYYNSQANYFQGLYVATNPDGSPRMVINSYPTLYRGSTINFISPESSQYDANGQQSSISWRDRCYDGSIVKIQQSTARVSNQFAGPSGPRPAYFNYIPNVYSGVGTLGLPMGRLTGWSGAATYDPISNTYTANYPSGPQPSDDLGPYNKSGARYMGVFVDLPNPASGYVDQRSTIRELVNPQYPQQDDSGLEYDPITQTIRSSSGEPRSISASHMKPDYNAHQSPVYDSLMNAAAYFTAYKQKDPYNSCRTNAVVLIYDGHEDARYTVNPNGSKTYADPSRAAAALLQQNVKTYVVIISSDAGDIAQANAIAQAGGTNAAYQVNNANDLTNALTSVFNALQGAVVTAAPAVPGFVQDGSLAYALASNNAYGAMQGFLHAFSTDANGNVSSSPVWSLQMTKNERQTALLTDEGSGTAPIQLQNAPPSLFGSPTPTNPDPQTIINYTIDPSYSNGQYLAGRQPGSFLGTITSRAVRPIILKSPNNPYLMSNTGYQSFARSNAGRQPLVLFTANDGFLYAISSGSTSSPGTLQWAWIPSPLVAQLKNYSTFQSTSPMNGGMQTVDSADDEGNWATYIVGTAQSGALHYGLKLSNCTSGSSCTPSIQNVWLDQQSGATSPPAASPQAPQIWWDANGIAYAYYFTTASGTSYLNVMRLYDGSTSTSSALPFIATSTVSIDVQGGKLYVGGQDGSIWMFDLTAGTTASEVANTQVSIGNIPNEPGAGPVRYVGWAQTGAGTYVWATTDHQVTVFKFTGGAVNNSPSGWTLWWWASSTGSGKTSVSSSGTASTTTTTSDPGVTSTSAPYWLQSGATITDASAVAANTLIVPVTVGQSSNACAATMAVYDLFDLDTGIFPQNKFFDANHNALVTNPTVGLGTAYTPVVSQNGAGQLIVYGSASQSQQGEIGFQVAATSGIHISSGIMGWQPVWMTMP